MDMRLSATDLTNPRIAQSGVGVVIPIFRHSVLLVEAIECVLHQNTPFPIHVVLVNDGCPHRETDDLCRDYAYSYPEQITYLRKANGGLSDARNHGIRHILSHLPSIEAIYMMDADNQLREMSLARAMAELAANPEVDWIYPNIDMFGLSWAGDYGGDYSLLLHSQMNLCEAGSLIHRRVFEAGILFDTSFKSGFEDWDFFLSAAGAGFRGRNLENFGFLYRKRGESMLADSERESVVLKGEIQRKHRAIYSPRTLANLEQIEAPRFAIVLTDVNQVRLTLDPSSGNGKSISLDEYEERYWCARTGNSRYHVPPILVVTRSETLEKLEQARLLHASFWMLERELNRVNFAALDIQTSTLERLSSVVRLAEGQEALAAQLIMVQPQFLHEVCNSDSMASAVSLSTEIWRVPASVTQLSLFGPTVSSASSAIALPRILSGFKNLRKPAAKKLNDTSAAAKIAVLAKLQGSLFKAASRQTWEWRHPDIHWRHKSHLIGRTVTGSRASYPRASDGRIHVGFLLPLVEFGGVERVALNVAQALRRAGLAPHLFILDTQSCHFSQEWRDCFESVTFLADPQFATWGSGNSFYAGTSVSDWARFGDHGDAVAMLAWLDVVLNFHGGAISGIMGKLRRFGVKTGISLHLSDLSPFQRPVGNTYNGLAFEHAYDLFLPCSHQLADWCHAMGIPEEKIVPIPNAPGFPLPHPLDVSNDRRRARRTNGEALRVIYLGRLDPQKGLDRLLATITLCQSRNLPIQWRIVGKAVFAGAEQLPTHMQDIIEPPLTSPNDLAAALNDADVLFLPSYYEGLPLTILEAMRSGVVPVATDVGAVAEILHHQGNGILLSGHDIPDDASEALARLASDSAYFLALSSQAQADLNGRDWDSAVASLLARLRPTDLNSDRK